MIFLDINIDLLPTNQRIAWEKRPTVDVSCLEPWSRGTIRSVKTIRDEQGYVFPLRDSQILVNVVPTKIAAHWRAEAESIGAVVVGRGNTSNQALADWKKRFRATIQRFLEMRPFEMTSDDKVHWEKIQNVIDVPHYKATKPLSIIQTGMIRSIRGEKVRVKWADGSTEWVTSGKFDESFSKFKVGQPFEALVSRHPFTFRLLRAEAVRKIPSVDELAKQRAKSLWDRLSGDSIVEPTPSEINESFWLKPPG